MEIIKFILKYYIYVIYIIFLIFPIYLRFVIKKYGIKIEEEKYSKTYFHYLWLTYDLPILSSIGIIFALIIHIFDYTILYPIYGLLFLLYMIIVNSIRLILKKKHYNNIR